MITRSDVEIMRDRLARTTKHGRDYIATHEKLMREVEQASAVDFSKMEESAK